MGINCYPQRSPEVESALLSFIDVYRPAQRDSNSPDGMTVPNNHIKATIMHSRADIVFSSG